MGNIMAYSSLSTKRETRSIRTDITELNKVENLTTFVR